MTLSLNIGNFFNDSSSHALVDELRKRISEEDMKLRGYGDLLGFKHSGLQSFRLADPVLNEDLFTLAEKETKRIERDNINLNKFQSLLKLYDRADILNDIV